VKGFVGPDYIRFEDIVQKVGDLMLSLPEIQILIGCIEKLKEGSCYGICV